MLYVLWLQHCRLLKGFAAGRIPCRQQAHARPAACQNEFDVQGVHESKHFSLVLSMPGKLGLVSQTCSSCMNLHEKKAEHQRFEALYGTTLQGFAKFIP